MLQIQLEAYGNALNVGNLGQMGMEQHPSSAYTRLNEWPLLVSSLLSSSGGVEDVARTLPVQPFPGGLPQPPGHPTRHQKTFKLIHE